CTGPDEDRERIVQPAACLERLPVAPRPHHPDFARQVALRADTVAPLRVELRRIQDGGPALTASQCHLLNVRFSGTVTPFAGNTAFPKRRRAISVLRLRHCLEEAGVAGQTCG